MFIRHRPTTPSGGGTTTRPPAPKPTQTTQKPAPPPATGGGSAPSGRYSLENASNGQCLGENDAGYAVLVNTYECGSSPGSISYSWTYSAGANGTFRLISKVSGKCLQPSGSSVTIAACNGSTVQSWKVGTTTSSGRTIKNMQDGQCLLTGPPWVMTYTCNAADRAQLWRNISPM
ncbi:RICIN domain-containing protein [Streptomyces venezuelae]|uniref:RICIN domain-containing protein n=1 Tax=Streptomyces venezuelae TaxID=54571 RepID=UPI00278BFEEF|nr:RICIN domain-containing protein [Streptomyces venezuelae]